jgi:hypothetical protein
MVTRIQVSQNILHILRIDVPIFNQSVQILNIQIGVATQVSSNGKIESHLSAGVTRPPIHKRRRRAKYITMTLSTASEARLPVTDYLFPV